MTCIALGIIISVTKKDEEIAEEKAEKDRREETLRRMIDEQIAKEERAEAQLLEDFSIEDNAENPMNAVINNKI
jgi:cell division protein FtsW